MSFGSRDGAVVKALETYHCVPGSFPGPGVICVLSLSVLYSARRGFFFRFLWFFPVSKTNIWFDLIWVSLPNNSGGLDLSADGPVFKKNSLIFYFRTGVDVLPQNIESSLNIFSDSFFFLLLHVLELSCASCRISHLGEFDRLQLVAQVHSIIFKIICSRGLPFYTWTANILVQFASVVCCFALVQQLPCASWWIICALIF